MVQSLIDKLIQTKPRELVVIFMDRPPITITADDPLAMWLWLQAPTSLSVEDFTKAVASDLQNTQKLEIAA